MESDTKVVTLKLNTKLDMGSEIKVIASRHLRMRIVIVDRGGVFSSIHD